MDFRLQIWFPELNDIQLRLLERFLLEAYDKGRADAEDHCCVCGASPMTVHCNNAGCDDA